MFSKDDVYTKAYMKVINESEEQTAGKKAKKLSPEEFLENYFHGTTSVQQLFEQNQHRSPQSKIYLSWDCYSDGGEDCCGVHVTSWRLDYSADISPLDNPNEFIDDDGNVIILPFGKDGKIPVVEIEQTTFGLNDDEDEEEYDEDEDEEEYDEDEEINEERSTCTVNEEVDEEPITWGEILEKLNQIPKELWPYTPVFGYWPDNDGAHYVIDSNFTLDGGTEV